MVVVAGDPGHPSFFGDTGAKSADGRIVECDYTIHIARMLLAACENEPGVDMHLLRTRNDEVVKVSERARRAEDFGADLVLCVHVDSSPTDVSGASVIHWPGNRVGALVGSQIAHSWPAILRRTSKTYPAYDDGPQAWPRARNVLQCYPQTAVLVECGYASNKNDVDALVEETVQVQIIGALMQGIRCFRQLTETPWLKE